MSHLSETLAAYQARDPAARSKLEIFLLYPGSMPPFTIRRPISVTVTR